jgi:hypothetical protein
LAPSCQAFLAQVDRALDLTLDRKVFASLSSPLMTMDFPMFISSHCANAGSADRTGAAS